MTATVIFAEPRVDFVPTISDEELVARSARGDEPAFVELIERYHDRVTGLVRRLLGRGHGSNTDDVVQEIYITLLGKLKTFQGASQFSTWLTSIVINRCRMEQRWTMRWWRWLEGNYTNKKTEDQKYDQHLEHEIEQNEERQAVKDSLHQSLAKLEQRDREVLTLRYFDERSIDEIATLLNCKPNAAEVRLNRARNRLRKVLEAEGNLLHENAKE
jgi:RNA polymerase sigma-70 factor (ECF subfamily)